MPRLINNERETFLLNKRRERGGRCLIVKNEHNTSHARQPKNENQFVKHFKYLPFNYKDT